MDAHVGNAQVEVQGLGQVAEAGSAVIGRETAHGAGQFAIEEGILTGLGVDDDGHDGGQEDFIGCKGRLGDGLFQVFGDLAARFGTDHAADDAGQDDFFPSPFVGIFPTDADEPVIQDVDGIEGHGISQRLGIGRRIGPDTFAQGGKAGDGPVFLAHAGHAVRIDEDDLGQQGFVIAAIRQGCIEAGAGVIRRRYEIQGHHGPAHGAGSGTGNQLGPFHDGIAADGDDEVAAVLLDFVDCRISRNIQGFPRNMSKAGYGNASLFQALFDFIDDVPPIGSGIGDDQGLGPIGLKEFPGHMALTGTEDDGHRHGEGEAQRPRYIGDRRIGFDVVQGSGHGLTES